MNILGCLKSIMEIVISILFIILVGSFPFMFNGENIDFTSYINGVKLLVQSIISLDVYYYSLTSPPRELFPDVWEPYLFSMSLLLLTVLISTVTAVVLTISITLLPDKWRNRSKFIFFITESIPDIFFVVVVQALVIWFYKKTDVLLFSVVSGYEEQALTIPLITLCILPTFFIARILTLRFNEERIEEYVQFAVSKGLRKSEVIIKHILPNTLVNLFSQSKFIVWFVLSNLVMVEYIFNIHGITAFIIRFSSPEVFTLCVILIFVPLYIIILIFQKLLHFWVGDQI